MTDKNTGNRGLSPKEEAYAQARASGKSGIEAALSCGYSPGSRKGAGVQAARLNARPHIRERIAVLLGSEGVDDARAEHIRELETLREMAKVKGHSAVAVRAQELLGRARGVGGDEHTVNMAVHTPLADVSSSDLRAALASVISQNSSLADLLGDQSAAFKQSDQADQTKPDEGKAIH